MRYHTAALYWIVLLVSSQGHWCQSLPGSTWLYQYQSDRRTSMERAQDNAELLVFPGSGLVHDNYLLANDHVSWLEARANIVPSRDSWELYEWIVEARYCRTCWSALDDAHRIGGPTGRRTSLAVLKDILGETSYRQGRMPPPVPVRYFRSMNKGDYR